MKWWQFLIFILLFLLCEFGYRYFLPSPSSLSASPEREDLSSQAEKRKEEEEKEKETDENRITYQYLEVDKYFKFDNNQCWINNRSYKLNRNFGLFGRIVLILDDSVILSSAKKRNEYIILFQKEYLRDLERKKEIDEKNFSSSVENVVGDI